VQVTGCNLQIYKLRPLLIRPLRNTRECNYQKPTSAKQGVATGWSGVMSIPLSPEGVPVINADLDSLTVTVGWSSTNVAASLH